MTVIGRIRATGGASKSNSRPLRDLMETPEDANLTLDGGAEISMLLALRFVSVDVTPPQKKRGCFYWRRMQRGVSAITNGRAAATRQCKWEENTLG